MSLSFIAWVLALDHVASPSPPETLPAETRDLWPAVTIYATAHGDFGGQTALAHNRIFQLLDAEPDFLKEFRTKLGQRRWIESDTDPGVLKKYLHEFDNYFQDAATGVEQRDRVSSDLLLYHLLGAFLNKGWKKGNLIKEDNVWWVFEELAEHFESILGSREWHAFRSDWPFKLVVSVESERSKYCYTPRSYFHVSVDRLVYLLVEVQSENNQGDRYRVLLQAACVARLGRKFYDDSFIVMALYIENTGRVTRYFLFQPDGDDRRVSYVEDVRYWTQPFYLFTDIFEIYNLVSVIQSDRPVLEGTRDRIDLLSADVSKNFKNTFTSKRTQGDAGKNSLQRGEHVYHDRQVVDAFTLAGYTLGSNDNDWAPLNKLMPTMRHAKQSNSGAVVVKLLYPGSNELQILRYLRSIKSSYNPTISFETIHLNMDTFIILPKGTPLDLGFAIGLFRSEIMGSFSRQLIEGVAFLHLHGIAHLDIKPENIVVLRNQFFIIDFDLSVRVDGPNTLIDHWCGTPEWMAPEIGYHGGPKFLYSPIRADLWSCGLVLRYLARKGTVEEHALTRQLLNKTPRLRPLLYGRHSVAAEHSLSGLQGGLKRKPDALSHDAKRPAVGTGHD